VGAETKERKEKKMNDKDLRTQINSLIRDEIQEDINDYVDAVDETKKAGLGFVSNDDKVSAEMIELGPGIEIGSI